MISMIFLLQLIKQTNSLYKYILNSVIVDTAIVTGLCKIFLFTLYNEMIDIR